MNDDRRTGRAGHRVIPVPMLAVGLVAVGGYAWWAVGLAPFSGAATAAVLIAGVVAIGLGLAQIPRPGPSPARAASGAGLWALLVVVTAAWQFAALFQQPRHDHPTLSSLANALLDSHLARAAAFVVWLAGAVALARR